MRLRAFLAQQARAAAEGIFAWETLRLGVFWSLVGIVVEEIVCFGGR